MFIVGNNNQEVKRGEEEIDLVCTKENEEYKNEKKEENAHLSEKRNLIKSIHDYYQAN